MSKNIQTAYAALLQTAIEIADQLDDWDKVDLADLVKQLDRKMDPYDGERSVVWVDCDIWTQMDAYHKVQEIKQTAIRLLRLLLRVEVDDELSEAILRDLSKLVNADFRYNLGD